MATLINLEVKALPCLKLIGKEMRHNMAAMMQGDNPMGAFWGTCFAQNTFVPLEAQGDKVFDPAYVGVMLDWNRGDGNYSYVVGMLMHPDAAVPEGYYSADLEATSAGIGYIQGKDTGDVCSQAHELTEAKLKEAGHRFSHMTWCMELYNCPRYTTPNEHGQIILDYYIPLDEA